MRPPFWIEIDEYDQKTLNKELREFGLTVRNCTENEFIQAVPNSDHDDWLDGAGEGYFVIEREDK